MKRLVAVLTAAILGISLAGMDEGANATSTVRAAGAYSPTISFAACGDPDNPGDQCAMFEVPLDWANPDGTKIKLAVRMRPHTSATSKGVMLVNPGGPGGSGTPYVALAKYVPNNVGTQYDWVGWDPRGVGESTPSLTCNPDYFGVDRPNYVPRTPRLMKVWLKKTRRYAARCATSAAGTQGLLAHMTTLDNVRDMEALRQAISSANLGNPVYDKLNLYGFSYGTYLGEVYATTFPGNVGRFVLDGVIDPARYWYKSNLDQDRGFDRNLNIFFRWVAKHPRAYHLGRDWRPIRRGYDALLKKLDRHPAAHGKLGPDELTDAMLGAGYYVYGWDDTATAYSKLVRHGNGRPLFRMYADVNMGDDNGYAVYLGTQCTDAPAPAWRKQVRDAWRIHRRHPFLTWDNTWFNAPCRTWAAAAQARVAVSGAGAAVQGGRFLLVNETKDAATPYSGALRTRSLFPSSALIAGVGGITHAGSLSGVGCVDNRIAAFLNDGTLPTRLSGTRADVRCHKVPPPAATGGSRLATPGGLPSWLRDLLAGAQRP